MITVIHIYCSLKIYITIYFLQENDGDYETEYVSQLEGIISSLGVYSHNDMITVIHNYCSLKIYITISFLQEDDDGEYETEYVIRLEGIISLLDVYLRDLIEVIKYF